MAHKMEQKQGDHMKKRLFPLLLCAALLLPLGGCGGYACETYTAFCRSFHGEATWTVDDATYAGRITVLTDEAGEKTYTVAYSSPAALAGAVLSAKGETAQLSLGAITHPLEETAREQLCAVFWLFEPVAVTRHDRDTLIYTDGERRYEITLMPDGTIAQVSLATPKHTVTLLPKEGA
jgi:hypothetical protein